MVTYVTKRQQTLDDLINDVKNVSKDEADEILKSAIRNARNYIKMNLSTILRDIFGKSKKQKSTEHQHNL